MNNPANAQIVYYTKQLFAVSAVFQLSSITSFWGVALPTEYLLATRFNFGGPGLWSGMTIGAGFSMSLLFWRFNLNIKAMLDKANNR